MARTKVDNKLNVVIGTKAQVEGDTSIPENSIIVVTDEELKADEIAYSEEKNVKEAIDGKQDKLVAGDNITIDENTNEISASGGGGGGGVSIGGGFNLSIKDPYASGLEGDIFILGKNPDGVFGWHKQSVFSVYVTYTNVIMFQNTTTKNGLAIRTANAVLNTKTNSYMPVGLIGNGANQYTLFLLNKDTELHGEEL